VTESPPSAALRKDGSASVGALKRNYKAERGILRAQEVPTLLGISSQSLGFRNQIAEVALHKMV